MNIKAVVLSISLASFSIKNGLVISCTTGITISIDGEEMRLDVEGEKIRPADIEASHKKRGNETSKCARVGKRKEVGRRRKASKRRIGRRKGVGGY